MIMPENIQYSMSNTTANLRFMMNYIEFTGTKSEPLHQPTSELPNLWGNIWGFVMADESAIMEDIL